jgi:hypothetical protein
VHIPKKLPVKTFIHLKVFYQLAILFLLIIMNPSIMIDRVAMEILANKKYPKLA